MKLHFTPIYRFETWSIKVIIVNIKGISGAMNEEVNFPFIYFSQAIMANSSHFKSLAGVPGVARVNKI